MILDMDMFYIWVTDVVFGKALGGVIVAKQGGWKGSAQVEAAEEFTEESDFMAGVMQGYVFRVTRGVSHTPLFLGHPRDRPRAEVETVAADGTACLNTISVVRVAVAKQPKRISASQGKAKGTRAFQVTHHTNGRGPMVWSIAV